MTDRAKLLEWAETCDEIAKATTDQEAVSTSAQFVALRLRRIVAEQDREVVEETVQAVEGPTCPACGESVKDRTLPLVRLDHGDRDLAMEMPCGVVVTLDAFNDHNPANTVGLSESDWVNTQHGDAPEPEEDEPELAR